MATVKDSIDKAILTLALLTGNIEHIKISSKADLKLVPKISKFAKIPLKDKLAPVSIKFEYSKEIKIHASFSDTSPSDETENVIRKRNPTTLVV